MHGDKGYERIQNHNATAIISMMIATLVFAQAAIQEPGVYAFYHSNAISCIPAGPCQLKPRALWGRYRSAAAMLTRS